MVTNLMPTVVYDWFGNANNALMNTLARMQVKHALEDKTSLFPVQAVTLTGPKSHGGSFASRLGGADDQSARLIVTLSEPVGNYNMDAVNNAIHAMLEAVPVLNGKLNLAKDVAVQAVDHAAVWKELEPLLTQSGKFSAAELNMFGDYFERTKARKAEAPEWSPVTVRHVEDKVQVNLSAFKLADDKSVTTPGAVIIEYFNHHKSEVLAKMREKVAALKVMTAEELAALDFSVSVPKDSYGRVTVEFGSKATPPETALGKTALAKIDTTVMREIFTASMLEARSELPAIFPLVANGEMVGKAIRSRVTDNPALHKALDHEMFLSEKEAVAKFEARQKTGAVEIGNAVEGDDPHSLTLNFLLPHGVTLASLRESIVRGCKESVLPVVQPAPANRVVEPAPVGRVIDPATLALAN